MIVVSDVPAVGKTTYEQELAMAGLSLKDYPAESRQRHQLWKMQPFVVDVVDTPFSMGVYRDVTLDVNFWVKLTYDPKNRNPILAPYNGVFGQVVGLSKSPYGEFCLTVDVSKCMAKRGLSLPFPVVKSAWVSTYNRNVLHATTIRRRRLDISFYMGMIWQTAQFDPGAIAYYKEHGRNYRGKDWQFLWDKRERGE